MEQYFVDTSNVPSFSLESRDWFLMANFMRNNFDLFDDVNTQLKNLQRVIGPPVGATPMVVNDTYLGLLLRLYYSLETTYGKTVGKDARDRFNAALVAIAGTFPIITTFMTAVDTANADAEAYWTEEGRKHLRGKLG